MKIISIDVGLNHLGVALFHKGKLQSTRCLKPTPSWSLEKKIQFLYDKLKSLMDSFFSNSYEDEDTLLLFENPYFSFNSPTGKKLDYVVGIIYLLSAQYGCTLESYTATEVKKELGVKASNKKQSREQNKSAIKLLVDAQLVKEQNLVGFTDVITDHEVDAIAVGLCYLFKEQHYGDKS